VNDAWAPLSEVAELLGVSTGTVRHWRYRGWLDRQGNRRRLRVEGRLYSVRDAVAAEVDTRLSGQSHRAAPAGQPIAA